MHLQAMIEGRIKDLIINIPPGHAKSLLACVFLPAWVWIKRPGYRFLFGSYKTDYATRDSVKCRDLISSDWYQERWRHVFALSSVVNAKERFENNKKGVRAICAACSGTGDRGNLTCVDDPMSVDQASSDAERKRHNDWWTGTMTSRLNDLRHDHLLLIQQRLHEDDTTAVSLAQGGYVHLYLPQEFEVDRRCTTDIGWQDPRTEEGELLWPARIGPAEVAQLKLRLGSYMYAGQYQQRPSPAGGGIFKRHWWRYWQPKFMELPPVQVRTEDGIIQVKPVNLPDEFDEQLQSWDMSFKNLKENDYVAGGVWGVRGANRYLLDQVRKRLNFPETVQAVVALSHKWPKTTRKLVEDKANGPAVIATLRNGIAGLIPVEPDGGKVARAQAASPLVEAGNVFIPHPAIAPWVDGFIDELAAFPNGANDDQVDQTTQALNATLHQMPKSKPIRNVPGNVGDRGWMA